ncbi:MAG: protein-L-isoaspartate(D-aspartate) O-methyltransferase [archaeon]
MDKEDHALQRRNMVKYQIRERGIKDERVLSVMEEVERHEFVPRDMRGEAYRDYPLPIGEGQTISQPYMVALMTECLELRGNESVLEVGTGSGYQTAVLSRLAKSVVTVEIRDELFKNAKKVLSRLGYKNVTLILSDGSTGYEKDAPYDRIIVTAACEEVPEELFKQLKEGGILVIPVGGMFMQTLFKIRKIKGKASEEAITNCVFVPLVGGSDIQ